MIGALVRWLPLSLAIHAAALAATLLLPRELALAPLFVDLTLEATVSHPSPPDGRRAGDGRPAAAPQPARRAAPPAGRGVSAVPTAPDVAPPAESPPVAPPPSVTRPVATPPVALATPEPSVVSPAPVTPSAVSTPPAAPAPIVASTPSTSSAPEPGEATGESPRATAWGGNGASGDAGLGTASKEAGGGSTSARGGGEGRAHGTGDGTLALAIPGDGGGVYGSYLARLRRRVQQSVTYPESARRRSLAGTVQLEIALEASGRITEVTLVRSSSHPVLDEAAMDGVRALRRVPFPSDVRPRPLRVRLPVVFELR